MVEHLLVQAHVLLTYYELGTDSSVESSGCFSLSYFPWIHIIDLFSSVALLCLIANSLNEEQAKTAIHK